ncbi:hypothetical protein QBC40DRAFT_255564 [Triangularia verruculosa]|uniref:Ribosomal RNA methyltransferase FtsJ domain-containing protein n=1 Tax=Triangularia verruculosa TaxID=2587418 RepID=A0AAN7ATX8_9PEZI|nr:hypothetical protein QBC40DRAFT_255564 [Triangularia verruculosa]
MNSTAKSLGPVPITSCDEVEPRTLSLLAGEAEQDYKGVISAYLRERVPEFRRLDRLRQQGWDNPEGDKFFKTQRSNADKIGDIETSQFHYGLMQRIAAELHNVTSGCFTTTTKPGAILDVCAAPGGFLAAAIARNDHDLQVRACTLPFSQGGYKILLPYEGNNAIKISYLDITMLAEDMGVDLKDIPASHPDQDKFMPRQFANNEKHYYDIAICDGHVLRTQERSSYREKRESVRLQTSSFVLALEHLLPGGTLIVLLHKIEMWRIACLLQTMSRFSEVQVHKPKSGHAKRSSFYMVAKDVRSDSKEAEEAVQAWKDLWRVATFGSDEEAYQAVKDSGPPAEQLLAEFGPELVELGRSVWLTQANALAKAPFIKNQKWGSH